MIYDRVSYSGFCSATGMRDILIWEAQLCPKNNNMYTKVFCVFLDYDKNIKQRDINILCCFLKEIIARNLTYLNILCHFLAILALLKLFLAENLWLCYFSVKDSRLNTPRHFFSNNCGIRHSPKLWQPDLL